MSEIWLLSAKPNIALSPPIHMNVDFISNGTVPVSEATRPIFARRMSAARRSHSASERRDNESWFKVMLMILHFLLMLMMGH